MSSDKKSSSSSAKSPSTPKASSEKASSTPTKKPVAEDGDVKDAKQATPGTPTRALEVKKRPSQQSFILSFEGYSPSTENVEEAKASKSKWSVSTVLKQFKTGKLTLKFLATVKELLREPSDLAKFTIEKGFQELIGLPQKNDYEKKTEAIKLSIVDLVSSFAKEDVLYKEICTDPVILAQMVLWADVPGSELKANIYTLFAVIPLVAKNEELAQMGYYAVLQALEHYNYQTREPRRFQHLVQSLYHEKAPRTILGILSLVNMLVNVPEDLNDRVAMRAEFRGIGIDQALEVIQDNKELNNQDIFDNIKGFKDDAFSDEEDYKDLLSETTRISIEFGKHDAYVNAIEKRLKDNSVRINYFLMCSMAFLLIPLM